MNDDIAYGLLLVLSFAVLLVNALALALFFRRLRQIREQVERGEPDAQPSGTARNVMSPSSTRT